VLAGWPAVAVVVPGMRRMSGGTLLPKAARAAASSENGPCSTSVSSSCAVERMISLARFTSVTPGSWTRIWSTVLCRATIGSETPSSLTRLSIVCSAWFTVSSRSWTTMLGRSVKV
jgi:hypothetical protein